MSASELEADLKIVVALLSLAVSLGQSVMGPLTLLFQLVFQGKPLTDEQRAALTSNHNQMNSELQAPLAPEPSK